MPSSATSIAFGAANDLVVLAASEDGEPVEWVRLLPMGEFKGRDGRGPYRIDDMAHAQAIVDTSLAYAASADPVVDYDHQSDYAAKDGVGGTAPASGWIVEMQARAEGVFGRIDWTERARALLKGREYRYLSPVFPHDKKTGQVRAILRAGLTNKPNLDLGALASEADHPGEDMSLTAIASALGLEAAATEADCLGAITTLKAAETGMVTVAQAAGLDASATVEGIVTAIASAATAATPDPAKFVPIETVLALQSQGAADAAKTAAERAIADVDDGIAKFKIAPALRDNMIALASSDRPRFDAFMEKAPVVIQPGKKTDTPVDRSDDALSAEELAVCASLGIPEATFLETKKKEAA